MGRARIFQPSEKTQQAIQNCYRMRRAAGDVEINRQGGIDAVVDFGEIADGAAADGARANRNHDLESRSSLETSATSSDQSDFVL